MGNVVTTIDMIRHGEPLGGVLIRGSQDDPLSDKGWRQMWEAVGKNRPWEAIVASPLSRCAEFAQRLGQRLRIPVTEAQGLREIGFGEWEGADPAALYAADPAAVENFWTNPVAYPPPGGEPVTDFQDRVIETYQTIIDSYSGKHLLMVAHGGVIRMVVAHILGMPATHLFRMEVPYAALSRICVEEGIPRLRFHCGSL